MSPVWDVVCYWREARLLEARRRLWADLAPDVDYRLVACVGDRTHRGSPLGDVPPPPAGRIIRVALTAGDDWGRERQQRDEGALLARRSMAPTDLVLLCDADEIVDPRRLPDIAAAARRGPAKLSMQMWYHGTRWRSTLPWSHPAAMLARHLRRGLSTYVRNWHDCPWIGDAGWHLSYFDPSDTDTKLASFAHAELDTDDARAQMVRGAVEGLSPHGDQLADDPLTGPLAEVLHAS